MVMPMVIRVFNQKTFQSDRPNNQGRNISTYYESIIFIFILKRRPFQHPTPINLDHRLAQLGADKNTLLPAWSKKKQFFITKPASKTMFCSHQSFIEPTIGKAYPVHYKYAYLCLNGFKNTSLKNSYSFSPIPNNDCRTNEINPKPIRRTCSSVSYFPTQVASYSLTINT